MLVLSLDARLTMTWGYVLGEALAPGSPRFAELLGPGQGGPLIDLAGRVLRTGAGQRAELELTLGGERRTYDVGFERIGHG
ncbi:MAG TPA: hypothetical protein VGC42_28720, partial [Kofleriaceae bacterium]